MDICMILIRKKKSLFYHMLEKKQLFEIFARNKTKVSFKEKKKKTFENSFDQKVHFARIRSH